MLAVSQALDRAIEHHQAGRLHQAEQLYREILQVDPQQVDALHLLGVVAHQTGRNNEAIDSIRQALALNGGQAIFHNSLGAAYQALGKLPEAVACYEQAVRLQPQYAEAHNNLGQALKEQGRLEEAVASCQQALRLKPAYAAAHSSLGTALLEQGRLEEAIGCYRRALQIRPEYAEAHFNLGNALNEQGRLAEAISCYRQALRIKPDLAQAHLNLGVTLAVQGDLTAALACYRQALQIKPDSAEAHNNLGNALQEQGRLEQAVASYRRALQIRPDFAEAYNNLGNALKEQGQLAEAITCYRRALEIKSDYVNANHNLLFCLQYRTGVTLSELAEAHADFDCKHAASLHSTWKPHANNPDPERRLRLGFLSADLHGHPVGYFLIRCLENLDRAQAEAICYSDSLDHDDLTTRFRAAATAWRDVFGWSDERLAEQIRADRIDVLFDLAGHTAKNRLLVFARKPAPLQVTWAGYVGTTGMQAMDYILADRYEIPPEAEPYYCERVLRLPDGYVTYDPPAYAPPVTGLPALRQGYVTFGSFNNPAKIGPQVVEVWARVLRRSPQARLVLKYKGIDDPAVAGNLAEKFAGHGVDAGRVEFLGHSSHADLLGHYRRIDMALDPFPFNGGLTTLEALWMGVPVITCPGETFAGRHSLAHLSNVGLTQTIARDLDGYVDLAVSLAGDLSGLAALRAGLRERLASSPLCDGPRFAAHLLQLLRGIWREWCRRQPTQSATLATG
jgi:predicted O-linked N-acetylglucosamine transferase (SPINDLY family)